GLKGCKATRGVGSRNIRAADLIHGPPWLAATQLDDGGIELARESWRRFDKQTRRILMIRKPRQLLPSAGTPGLRAFVLHYAARSNPGASLRNRVRSTGVCCSGSRCLRMGNR